LLVSVRLDGVLAKHIEMRLFDDRGVLSALMRFDSAPDRSPKLEVSPAVPADFSELEQALRKLLAGGELLSSRNNRHHPEAE
jgi:hypothetical protein